MSQVIKEIKMGRGATPSTLIRVRGAELKDLRTLKQKGESDSDVIRRLIDNLFGGVTKRRGDQKFGYL